MDEPITSGPRGNHGILNASHLRCILFMSSSRVSRSLLILIVALTSVAFFSFRHITFHHPLDMRFSHRFEAQRTRPNPFRSSKNINAHPSMLWRKRLSNPFLRNLTEPYQWHAWPIYGSSNSRVLASQFAFRTDSTCATTLENFVEEREVKTGDCSRGILCRARVIVSKQGASITIKAGYNILYRKGVTVVDESSKRNAAAVTRSEANKWSKELLRLIGPRLEGLNCDVTAESISDAIIQTKNEAGQCPRTDSPLCTQLNIIRTCIVAEPLPLETEQQKECRAFLESKNPVTSVDELVAKSPCIVWPTDNIVFMSAPLCKTRCNIDDCAHENIIYGEFGVLGIQIEPRRDGSDNENTCNSIATVFVSLFNSLVGANIPNCDDLTYVVLEAGFYDMFQLLVATDDSTTDEFDIPYEIPQHIQDITAQKYGTQVFGAIYVLPMSLGPYIEWQCSELE